MSRTEIKKNEKFFTDTLTESDLEESEDSEWNEGTNTMYELVHCSDVLVYSAGHDTDFIFGVQKADKKVNMENNEVNGAAYKVNQGKSRGMLKHFFR